MERVTPTSHVDPAARTRSLSVRLRDTTTVTSLAAATLDEIAAAFGAVGAAMDLFGSTGAPSVCVASTAFDPAAVRAYMGDGWRRDACLARVRTSFGVVATTDDAATARDVGALHGCTRADSLVLGPIVGVEGSLLGMVRVARARGIRDWMRSELGAVCIHVSVRLARLGVTTHADRHPLAALTDRQRAIASRVARGLTNAEIAADLGVSENAIKKHLKLVMVALDLANRAELAALTGGIDAIHDDIDDDALDGYVVIRAS
jgi:DNA-binding CsgD family transcriptional regulator